MVTYSPDPPPTSLLSLWTLLKAAESLRMMSSRGATICATVLSTVCLTLIVIVLPLFVVRVQRSNSIMMEQVHMCQLTTSNIWRQLAHIGGGVGVGRGKREGYGGGRHNAVRPSGKCCTCQQGKAGPPGPVGQAGDDGENGIIGTNGRNGRPGTYVIPPKNEELSCQKCPQAIQGPPGHAGVKGKRGNPGTPGSSASSGTPGRNGPPGPPGTRGMPGDIGIPGPPGDQGRVLNGAPPGPAGRGGSIGPRGKAGNAGIDGRPGNPGLSGPRGVQGNRGNSGQRGMPGPPGPPGNPGVRGSCNHCEGVSRAPAHIPPEAQKNDYSAVSSYESQSAPAPISYETEKAEEEVQAAPSHAPSFGYDDSPSYNGYDNEPAYEAKPAHQSSYATPSPAPRPDSYERAAPKKAVQKSKSPSTYAAPAYNNGYEKPSTNSQPSSSFGQTRGSSEGYPRAPASSYSQSKQSGYESGEVPTNFANEPAHYEKVNTHNFQPVKPTSYVGQQQRNVYNTPRQSSSGGYEGYQANTMPKGWQDVYTGPYDAAKYRQAAPPPSANQYGRK